MNIKYVHTNIVARDWRKLADFYIQVLSCIPVLPDRDLSGKWLEDLTKVTGAHIRGMHLRLPGCGETGPTLEIFQYNNYIDLYQTSINQIGMTHLAFLVDGVEALLELVKEAGGRQVGELVKQKMEGIGLLTVVYATDPEGNIIELQHWEK